ncbi:tyrosine-type recombinase/integrase [Rhodovulum sp. MB263]|uniref:tyrosine-type recombinase/integrase n=1 Tax=Rhodovulum sp. (strain MB263) TaxID=308754 RepID=UPI003513CE51
MWTDDEGKRRRYRLEANTAREAEREARDLILRLDAPPAGMTVAQVWDAYRIEMGDRRQGEKMDFAAKVILPAFGHLSVDQITVADCRGYIAKRRTAGRKDGTIRSEMGCLRSALLWAQKSRLIPQAPTVEMPPVPAPRDRYLTLDEVDRLLAGAVDPHIRLAMLLMLTTAGRKGAILDLTWDRVDFKNRMIRLATADISPRKKRALVPINDTLMAALQEARQAAVSDYVVEWGGRRVGSIKTGFNAAVKRAGIAHCTPHDLRRSAGRFMAEAGVPIEEIAEYLGHTNPNITRSTYARFSPDYLRHAAGSLEFGKPKLVQRTKVQSSRGRVSD